MPTIQQLVRKGRKVKSVGGQEQVSRAGQLSAASRRVCARLYHYA